MKCPIIVRIRESDYSHKLVYPANCMRDKCAWWNISLGICGVVVDGYLKGLEIERQER